MITQSTITDQDLAVPVGTINLYPAVTPPTGWFMCDGSAVSRSTYSSLFSIIGTYYGGGNGTTTFNLPDMKGRMPVGYAIAGGHSDVSKIGNNDGLAVANRRPSHNHTHSVSQTNNLSLPAHSHSSSESAHSHSYPSTYNSGEHAAGGSFGCATAGGGGTSGGASLNSVTNTDGGGAAITGSITSTGAIGPAGTNPNNSAAYLVLNYMIKY